MRPANDMSELFAQDPDLIEVGIGQVAVAEAPKRLLTPALGSCVGVAVYDPVARRGGLAHIMLPTVSSGTSGDDADLLGRFADWAVPNLVQQLVDAGSLRRRLEAKLAGGAAMFRGDASVGGVGERNLVEVRRQLELTSVRLVAEDTGDAYARTVELVLQTGEFYVRSYQFGVRKL